MSDVWWCETYSEAEIRDEIVLSRHCDRCGSSVQHSDCKPMRLVSPDAVVVCRGPDGEWPGWALKVIRASYSDDPPDLVLDFLVEASRKETG